MAIGWLTILKTVPWAEVISNAPKVADGAKKLWQTVGKKSSSPAEVNPEATSAELAETENFATLTARIRATETKMAELHSQMLASSELIAALAEQNTQLIKRLEVHRKRVLWLGAINVILVISAVIGAIKWAVPG
ncbi:MAG: hypothetical protein CVU16_12430 [Betaproteobacteria bacterium HGW-Betaproteobacteria-10]|nr:MAG: hypothetical protein CVU16_12430 [Betaproteobacteria bacterium HGW-Betaproteobacteria-10]